MNNAKEKKKKNREIVIVPHAVHLDHCEIIAIAYKLDEVAIGEIVKKSQPTHRQ